MFLVSFLGWSLYENFAKGNGGEGIDSKRGKKLPCVDNCTTINKIHSIHEAEILAYIDLDSVCIGLGSVSGHCMNLSNSSLTVRKHGIDLTVVARVTLISDSFCAQYILCKQNSSESAGKAQISFDMFRMTNTIYIEDPY